MKPIYINGDLFQTPWHVIIHGCNSRGVMGSGVARIVKEKYPEAYETYRQEYEKNGLNLGDVIWAHSNGMIIGNCITQLSYGADGKQYADYEAIRSCMKKVNSFCLDNKYKVLSMPKIGAGLGGGTWFIIENIINEELVDVQPLVYVLD